jgi:multicomponent Na+:H+ antiporter subunit F
MISSPEWFLDMATKAAMGLLLLGVLLSIYRLIRGPDHADRIVALDLISTLVVAFLAVYAIHTDASFFLDVAIAYALIAFLGTLSLARYLHRSHYLQKDRHTDHREDAS